MSMERLKILRKILYMRRNLITQGVRKIVRNILRRDSEPKKKKKKLYK